MPGSSRRSFITSAVASYVGAQTTAKAGPLAGIEETTQTAWFNEVITKAPRGALHLYRFADEIYALTRPIGWVPPPQAPKELTNVDVPEGFITDFASVPRIFWALLPRDGKYTYPAIIHDYMYWTQDRSRETADEIFRIGMEEFGIGFATVNAVYWSVRAGGGWAWDANATLKAKGEKRVLKRFPTEPLVRWQHWKTQPENFE